MKSTLLALMSLIMGSFSYQGEKHPEITWEKTRHYFGKISMSETHSCDFVFTNTGNADLKIKAVKAGCRCTKVEFPAEPVPPGATDTIRIFYEPRTFGEFHEGMSVISNTPKKKDFIFIRGDALAPHHYE